MDIVSPISSLDAVLAGSAGGGAGGGSAGGVQRYAVEADGPTHFLSAYGAATERTGEARLKNPFPPYVRNAFFFVCLFFLIRPHTSPYVSPPFPPCVRN